MTDNPGPYDLQTTSVVLGPDGTATAKAHSPDFYAELDREFAGFAGHALISRHAFGEAWGGWERHPMGDEVITLISGDVDFVLWTDDGEKAVRVNEPGSCIVVPRGVWHTARPRAFTVMLFVTPGEGTEHAEGPTAFA